MEVNSRNPNNQILSASAHGSGCLPFLRLRIWPTFAVGQAAAVESEALLDTGASAFLMDWDFFVRNFPSTPTEKTEKILRYASGPATTTVSRMARMSFQIEGGRQKLILDETFFLIQRGNLLQSWRHLHKPGRLGGPNSIGWIPPLFR